MFNYRRLRLVSAVLVAGTCLQLGGCFSGAANFVGNFNPCGTILNCDPVQYSYIQSGYEGPGADPDVDPFCTWPGFCDPTVDPLAPFDMGARTGG